MKPVSGQRLLAIARKELLHILHDPRSLMIIFIMPVLQLVMFGYALNLEIQLVPIAVIDYDKSESSRQLISEFAGSPFFAVTPYDEPISQMEKLFLQRDARAILIIAHDFGEKLGRAPKAPVQLLIDGSDPNAATLINSYCTRVIQNFNARHAPAMALPFEVEPTIWFNPNMKSSYFFVPGLLAMLLIMICALLTSITIAREKETGTMEQILVSPVRPQEIIIGKVLPYIFISLLIGFTIVVIGAALFDVPFVGSITLLTLLSLVYIFTALSLGLMISTVVKTQQVAMMVSLVATLLPTVLLSGFIFPIQSMPLILQYISHIIPAKYYLHIARGIILKGNTLPQLWLQVSVLVGMSLLLLVIARRKFSANLEQ